MVVAGTQAIFRWAPAAGPVSGYQLFVSRNGSDLISAGMVGTNQVTLSGVAGDIVQVAVRAWGYPNGTQAGFDWGPPSAPSEPIRFSGGPIGEVYPLLDCASCGRFEIRDGSGAVVASYPYPSGGSWELVDLAPFVKDHPQALLRERTTGALWIGNVVGDQLVPYASQVSTGFAQFRALTSDLDGDGVSEILLQNQATGVIAVWAVQNGAIVRRFQWNGPVGWRLIGAADFDGDHQQDLWFDAGGGIVLVSLFRFSVFQGSTVLSSPVAEDASAVAVADYDGDWIGDLLFRDESGAMQIALTRGSPSIPSQTMVSLVAQVGDENVLPTGTADFDGDGGAELLLENQVTGATAVAFPLDPAVPGRRVGLLTQRDPSWRLVGSE
jgi:hypothetical protein